MADDADTLKTLKAELSAAKTDPENFAQRASAVSSSAIEILRGAAAATCSRASEPSGSPACASSVGSGMPSVGSATA